DSGPEFSAPDASFDAVVRAAASIAVSVFPGSVTPDSSVSEGSGWEGISDPARVLAEFALAWGRKSGARLTALASSM
ncbi:hypothetical protein, partial [Nocardia cyriacigeorgica]